MEPARLELPHPRGATPIVTGRGAFAAAAPDLEALLGGRTLFAVTTAAVRRLHPGPLERLAAAARRSTVLEVAEGEAAKSLATAQRLWRQMVSDGGKRDSLVAAFGGGSVGDVAGFVAGAFLRGVGFLQLPTTLLAQVDAAIGGKTAVDLPEAKNSVGLFHHPELVVCDVDLLATLPRRQLRSGLFEVLKVAVLVDPALLERIEEEAAALLAGEAAALAPLVEGAVRAKIAVVAADPEDRGGRRVLNFGHTLGHAVEAALGYRGLLHGEAVGYGMLFALRLAERRGLGRGEAERVRRLIGRLGLPALPRLAAVGLLERMARDKKAREEGLAWVLPAALGEGAGSEVVPEDELRRELDTFLAAPFDTA